MWGDGVHYDHDEFLAAQNEEFDREEEQLAAEEKKDVPRGLDISDLWYPR